MKRNNNMKRFVLLVGFLLLYTSRGCHQHEYYENEEMISAFDSITDLANKLRNDMWTHAWDFNQSIYSNSSEYFYNYNEGNPDPKSAASMPFARLGKLPLSLSILMNFDQFGTSSVNGFNLTEFKDSDWLNLIKYLHLLNSRCIYRTAMGCSGRTRAIVRTVKYSTRTSTCVVTCSAWKATCSARPAARPTPIKTHTAIRPRPSTRNACSSR